MHVGFPRILDHDIVTYTAEGQKFEKGQFSSNFLAGRKGSTVMGAIWKSQKEHMQRHCPKDMDVGMQLQCLQLRRDAEQVSAWELLIQALLCLVLDAGYGAEVWHVLRLGTRHKPISNQETVKNA